MKVFAGSGLRLFASAVALLGLLFAACGGDDSGGGEAKSDDQKDMAPASQQVLRTRITGEPKTIDPHLTNFANETTITKPLFSGLFTFDPEMRVVPSVAAEIPTAENGGVSKDGLTYTIKLRKDAKWSDGKPVTAKDFEYSMKRAMDPKLAGPYTSNYFALKGAEEYNTALGTSAAPKTATDAQLAQLRDALGVKAKDDYTIEYQLKEPDVSWLQKLAIWTAYPVRQDIVERFGDKWTEAGNIVSNGAFMLKEWAHNERFVMVPNPYWHGEPKPKLQQLIILMMENDAAAYAAYLNNELDIVGVPPANRREVQQPTNPLNKELKRGGDGTTFALMMNHKVPPFDNQKVREAFALAFDRKAFVEVTQSGVGFPVTTWIASNQPGHNPELGKQFSFDPVKAKAALAAAGFPDGRGLPKVTFLAVANDTNRNVIAPFVIENYKKNLGIDVEYEFVDTATYTSRYTRNQHQIAIGGWHLDWPYPDNWLPNILGCNQSNNHTQYCNPKFDELVKQAARETDDKKRLALYDQAQKLALDEVALAPIYEREYFVLVKPWVRDLVITNLDSARGDYNYHRIWIAAH
ncbi:MAG TPA: peptide ABC transporter substrate-binding protein [Dehalococcoidia bacterium]|nr:peptide ABC transporter substrate-binding protein [Dehalococcoidia bacterium]